MIALLRPAVLLLAPVLLAQSPPRVRGVVVDEADHPLAGVAVCAFVSSEPFVTAELARHPTTTTGADGTFELPSDSASWPVDSVMFVAPDRVHVACGLYYVDMCPIVLPRGRTLAGRVRDTKGHSLANVRVEARDWIGASGLFGVHSSSGPVAPEPNTAVRTDAAGRFVLVGTAASGIALRAGGDGFTTVSRGPLAADEPLDMVVEPVPVVTVEVVDAEGRPLPGVRVWCDWPGPTNGVAAGCTDREGHWRFSWAGEGPVAVIAQNRDSMDLGRIAVEAPVERVRLVAASPPSSEDPAPASSAPEGAILVRGRVVDPDSGAPVVDASVAVVARDKAERVDNYVLDDAARSIRDSVRTGSDGRFSLPVLPGEYQLVAATPDRGVHAHAFGCGRSPSPLPITIAAGSTPEPFELPLQPRLSLHGRIVAPVLPRGSMVKFAPHRPNMTSSAEDYDFALRFPVAADGTFTATGLTARDYQLFVLVPRGFRQGLPDKVLASVVKVAPGAEITATAPAAVYARLRGTVRSEVPATRLAVMSLPESRTDAMNWGCVHYFGPITPIGGDGSFDLRVPSGRRALLVVDLWSGVVLHRGEVLALEPGEARRADLEVKALPLDVKCTDLPAGTAPWLDLVVPEESWPSGLGNMVEIGSRRDSIGLGVSLVAVPQPFRLWLPPGTTRLVLRRRHGVEAGGKGVLADLQVDPRETPSVTLQAQ